MNVTLKILNNFEDYIFECRADEIPYYSLKLSKRQYNETW